MNKPIVITISGKARHGKDTTALILKRLLEEQGKTVAITRYSSHLRKICQDFFNWNGEEETKPRELLQTLGTDIIRKDNPNWHVNRTMDDIKYAGRFFYAVIIPDARFPNELTGDFNLKVIREGYESELTEAQQNHISETALDGYDGFDFVLSAATGDFERLERQLKCFLKGVIE